MTFEISAIDEGFKALNCLFESTEDIDILSETEADTRLKLIDPILKNVLGWLPMQIRCERSQDDQRLDYLLKTANSTAVVEAKKQGLVFDLGPDNGPRKLSLKSVYFKSGTAGDAVQQVKEYARDFGVGLAAATNGVQWIIFLASRSDGVPPADGFAFVFRSSKDLLKPEVFKMFYGLLSKRSVQLESYKAHFIAAEQQLRTPKPPTAKRLVESRRSDDQKRVGSQLAQALSPVLEELFLNLSKEKERLIIQNCFVTTKESIDADHRLERLITEITNKIEPLDSRQTSDNKLTKAIEQSIESTFSQTVLIVGHIGAGKSTFTERFFDTVLPPLLKKKVAVVRIDLENAQPNPNEFTAFLHREFIKELKREVFKTDQPEFEQLQGAFNSLYERWKKGELKFLFNKDPSEFNIHFGKKLLEMEENQQEEYIRNLLRYCNLNLRKLVCVVIDNVDHHESEIQTRAFLSAKWINGLGKVLCLLPIQDTTYWQASTEGPFHTRNQTTLYLFRPPLVDVLQARFKYAELQLDELDKEKRVEVNSLKGFRVIAKNAKELFQCFHRLFGREIKPNLIIRGLSGGNIREALRIFYECMTSPHMNIDRLLTAYLSNNQFRLTSRDFNNFEKAAILGHWRCYKHERNNTVANLFCFPRNLDSSPILGLRILERLYDIRTDSVIGGKAKGFEDVDNIIKYFELMAVPAQTTDLAILQLVNSKLAEPYNLSVLAQQDGLLSTERIKSLAIADSGRLLRYWCRRSAIYCLNMLEDIDIYDGAKYEELSDLIHKRVDGFKRDDMDVVRTSESEISSVTRSYLLDRDSEFVSVPPGDLFYSQRRILEVIFNLTVSEPGEVEALELA